MGSLERGLDAYERADWSEAYRLLSLADHETELGPEALWPLAVAALLVGRDDAFLAALERACHAHERSGDVERAAMCAFWSGFRLADLGRIGPASGWMARAERLAERAGQDGPTPSHGWLLIPRFRKELEGGEHERALALAERATAIADTFGDGDLHALALHAQGLARLRQARTAEGLALLDEAMLEAASDERLPIVTGIVYCSVIGACRDVYALERARGWTAALSEWCDRQPDLMQFTGACSVHRAEILRLHGDWSAAQAETQRAEERSRAASDPDALGAAAYERAELLRLRGRWNEAERAYQEAARQGRDPQPGLALLRSAQGRHGPAVAALRRALVESRGAAARTHLLPAAIDVLLAAGTTDEAAAALVELEEVAATYETGSLRTIAAHARGAVRLAEGDAAGALVALREAWRGWQALEAPYEAARTRELVARACAGLGDEEGAASELDAAREAYRRLGAAGDLRRLADASHSDHGLTPRELQVLRLVAEGHPNKRIAAQLAVSVRTVERHVANLFAKLQVSSRTAAAVFAHEHDLV